MKPECQLGNGRSPRVVELDDAPPAGMHGLLSLDRERSPQSMSLVYISDLAKSLSRFIASDARGASLLHAAYLECFSRADFRDLLLQIKE